VLSFQAERRLEFLDIELLAEPRVIKPKIKGIPDLGIATFRVGCSPLSERLGLG